ncbi:hypothetical protein NECAME_11722 [Necator americanus]|uniref:Uncharacterized protein n=1 Tax=Necator americanus TaxID=51031 RepID=W2T3A1_NECAM|nr:hypothetical protein NECAME_11722 [Necator americanus]ETN76368.1 hypothetical protein NECAME_11722 [Necator americanus]
MQLLYVARFSRTKNILVGFPTCGKMGDSNAWDMLVAEEPIERKKSASPSTSRMESQVVKLDEAELHALGLDKEDIAEEAERRRKSRSK